LEENKDYLPPKYLNCEKKCFYSIKIKECGKDQKKLFKLTKYFMGSYSNVNLQHITSAELLAGKFTNYS